jgi:hypothetical protein
MKESEQNEFARKNLDMTEMMLRFFTPAHGQLNPPERSSQGKTFKNQ